MRLSSTSAMVLVGLIAGSPLALAQESEPPKQQADSTSLQLPRIASARPRNIVLILVDDHRYDAMGFMGHPFLQTPNLDALARGGVHLQNAFVTTSLCSPSRASILTGMYAHRHRVVDNNNPIPPGTTFFAQYLQAAGYDTAFIGKWHMGGGSDEPRPGFTHWVSFRGQGSYLPNRNGLNVDGKHVPQKGYITDELTDYALDWLKSRPGDKPFMLYLSHKAVHSEFIPAERHKGKYANAPVTPPPTEADTPENRAGKPMWAQNQRNSFHGVGFTYQKTLDIASYYRRYCETLLGVDDSVGRILDWLREKNLLDSTLILYMGDNGFMFGEQGLIDKRAAYEASMRVPMIMHCPELIKGGTKVTSLVANIDVAPTFLEAAGLTPPANMDGRSMLAVAQGKQVPWRESLLYEYYWERNFPQTPTMHGLRTDRYKYVHYYGLWDIDELYDLAADPEERHNLIFSKDQQPLIKRLNTQLFDTLEATNGMTIPLYRDRGAPNNLRRLGGGRQAEFPPELMRDPAKTP